MSRDPSENNDLLPPWLRDVPLPPRPASHEPPAASAPVETGGAPAWMQAEPTPAASEPNDVPAWLSAAPAEPTPDWLQEAASEPAPSEQPGAADDVPDWLRGLSGAPAASTPSGGDLPDWLREAPPADAAPAAPESPPAWFTPDDQPALPPSPARSDATPAWLQDLADEPPSTEAPASSDATPAWLQDVAEEAPSTEAGVPSDATPAWLQDVAEEASSAETAVPDWLREDPSPSAPPPDQPAEQPEPWDAATAGPAQQPPAPAGDVPDWLQGISMDDVRQAMSDDDAEQISAQPFSFEGMEPASAQPPAAQPSSGPPSWFGDAGDDATSSWFDAPPPPPEPPAPASDDDEMQGPAWLADLGAEPDQNASADEPFFERPQATEEPSPADDVPPWLRGAEQAEPSAPGQAPADVPDWLNAGASVEPPAAPAQDVPLWLQDEQRQPAENVPAWLRDDVAGAPLEAAPESAGDVPAWLQDVADDAASAPAPAEPAASDWLAASAETEEPPAAPAEQESDLPPWLRDEAGAPMPTAGAPGEANLPEWLRGATIENGTAAEARPPARAPVPPAAPPPPAALGGWFDDAPAGPAAQPSESDSEFLGGTDLPAWLRSPEPEAAPAIAPVDGRSLDWLTQLGGPEEEAPVAVVAAPKLTPPALPPRSAQHNTAVALLQQLAADPYPAAAPLPQPAPASLWRRIGMDRLLYIALLLVLLAALAVPSLAASLQAPPVVSGAPALFEQVSALSEDDVVLLGYDWDARRISELRPLEQAVIEQLIQQNVKLVMISTDTQGTLLLYDLRDRLEQAGYEVGGVDYLLLGYRPGGELALRSLAQNFEGALAIDFFGRDATESPLVRGELTGRPLRSLTDLSMVMVMADDSVDVQGWMEQVYRTAPDVPFAFLLPAEAEPITQPYLRLDNVFSLSGKRGALAYQALRGEAGDGQVALESGQQRLGLLVFSALLVVGVVAGAITAAARRKDRT